MLTLQFAQSLYFTLLIPLCFVKSGRKEMKRHRLIDCLHFYFTGDKYCGSLRQFCRYDSASVEAPHTGPQFLVDG